MKPVTYTESTVQYWAPNRKNLPNRATRTWSELNTSLQQSKYFGCFQVYKKKKNIRDFNTHIGKRLTSHETTKNTVTRESRISKELAERIFNKRNNHNEGILEDQFFSRTLDKHAFK